MTRKFLPLKLTSLGAGLRQIPPEQYRRAVEQARTFGGGGLRFGTAPQTVEAAQRGLGAGTPRVVVGTDVEIDSKLFWHIDELEPSIRLDMYLNAFNIRYVGELVQKSEQDLLKIRIEGLPFGRKLLSEVKDLLEEMGLSLGMSVEGFSREEADRRQTDKALREPRTHLGLG